MSVPSYEARREAAAAMGARQELGPEYEAQIAAGLAERVEHAVWQQHQHGNQYTQVELAKIHDERASRAQRFALAIISLGTGIPLTAIGAELVQPGLLGIGVTWAGIVGVNAVFGLRDRFNRRR